MGLGLGFAGEATWQGYRFNFSFSRKHRSASRESQCGCEGDPAASTSHIPSEQTHRGAWPKGVSSTGKNQGQMRTEGLQGRKQRQGLTGELGRCPGMQMVIPSSLP